MTSTLVVALLLFPGPESAPSLKAIRAEQKFYAYLHAQLVFNSPRKTLEQQRAQVIWEAWCYGQIIVWEDADDTRVLDRWRWFRLMRHWAVVRRTP